MNEAHITKTKENFTSNKRKELNEVKYTQIFFIFTH